MIDLPWLIVIGCVFILSISIYYNFKFAFLIIKMEDQITESLDILDAKYNSLSKVLEMPLFFDSPQVRKVVDDIRVSRDSILIIANKLANIEEDASGEEKNS